MSDVTVSIPDRVRSHMPELVSELVQLVDMPSISHLDHMPPALLEARDFVVALLRSAGVDDIETLSLPDTAPVIVGSIPAPEGAPTVLLYAHYDVVPGGDLGHDRPQPAPGGHEPERGGDRRLARAALAGHDDEVLGQEPAGGRCGSQSSPSQ